ncbi:hypothetical protein [Photobacterium kishitanii]|uniref:hypothetical protein n=1 Tax=Photobacterium kishitanii TaxID=318456 RepID=UPI001EFD3ED1|nr:hypothetical protein [Photobacterium kishitanii]
MDSGARRNLPIFRKVKKGDILLVPRLPTWNEVAIVEATQDFDEGYDFSIHPELEDFGHIFPEPILVERTGGPAEKDHGTDIFITLPGLLGKSYGIAIQVKDYRGLMSDGAIEQIQKADYWNNENFTVIDKYVIVTRCLEDDHPEEDFKDVDGVTILFAEQLESLLKDIATGFIGLDRN